MQSKLFRRLFHRKLSGSIERYLLSEDIIDEPYPGQCVTAKPTALHLEEAISWVMPKTVRELLTDSRATEPRYVRLHNANYSSKDLLSEILSMANRIARRISAAQLSSTDKRWWPVREMASKWDSIKAYPEMLQDADVELLKILVLDAYADMERLEGTAGRA